MARVDELTTECKELNEQIERLRDELAIARESNAELTTHMHDQEDVIDGRAKQVLELQEQIVSVRALHITHTQNALLASRDAATEATRSLHTEHSLAMAQVQEELCAYRQQLDAVKGENDGEKDKLTEQCAELQKEVEFERQRLAEACDSVQQLEAEVVSSPRHISLKPPRFTGEHTVDHCSNGDTNGVDGHGRRFAEERSSRRAQCSAAGTRTVGDEVCVLLHGVLYSGLM